MLLLRILFVCLFACVCAAHYSLNAANVDTLRTPRPYSFRICSICLSNASQQVSIVSLPSTVFERGAWLCSEHRRVRTCFSFSVVVATTSSVGFGFMLTFTVERMGSSLWVQSIIAHVSPIFSFYSLIVARKPGSGLAQKCGFAQKKLRGMGVYAWLSGKPYHALPRTQGYANPEPEDRAMLRIPCPISSPLPVT